MIRGVVLVCAAVLAMGPEPAMAQGTPLGPEFRVNTYTTSYQDLPSVASDASGSFVVVWSSYSPGEAGRGIFGQRFADTGGPIGPEFHVNSYTTGDQLRPAMASDATGGFVVVWESGQDGSATGIFGQRYAASGTPLGPEFRVNTYTTGNQLLASVTAGPGGSFVAVWNSPQDGSGGGIFGQRYAGSGAPEGPEFRVNTSTTPSQFYSAVAADAAGNFVVVWANGGGTVGIYGQRFAASGPPLGPEFRVNTTTFGYQKRPSVASDPVGNFVVVWEDYQLSLRGQRFAATGAPAGPEFFVTTYPQKFPVLPSVAADATGNFVVTWTEVYFGDVLGRRFAADGTPLSATFLVNTYTTNGQGDASVAADALGRFVVVWTSVGQDGSQPGVFGQRYAPILPVELIHFSVQ